MRSSGVSGQVEMAMRKLRRAAGHEMRAALGRAGGAGCIDIGGNRSGRSYGRVAVWSGRSSGNLRARARFRFCPTSPSQSHSVGDPSSLGRDFCHARCQIGAGL